MAPDKTVRNVTRRKHGVFKKADDVYLMDHGVMSAAVFLKDNVLEIYESTPGWLLAALQNGNLVR